MMMMMMIFVLTQLTNVTDRHRMTAKAKTLDDISIQFDRKYRTVVMLQTDRHTDRRTDIL